MAQPSFLKRFSAVSVAAALLGLEGREALAQDPVRVNQDELASFYGRMNVVVGSGARAFGMGGAFLARADDATAASWNPAGLSYLRRTEVSLVGVHNEFSQKIPRFDTSVEPNVPVTATDRLQGSVADFIGAAYPLRLKGRTGAIQLSYQRSFSFTGTRLIEGTIRKKGFGLNGQTVLPIDFSVEGNGGFDSLSLSSGFEVHSRLRLGVSVNRWINGFSQEVSRPERSINSDWKIKGTNFNFGLLFTPSPSLNLGAVLKTPFAAKVGLTKHRIDNPTVPDPITGEITPEKRNDEFADVQIRFPRVYGFGASYRVTNTVTVSADFTQTSWSQATITDFFSLPRGDVLPKVDRYGTLPFPAVEEGANGQTDTDQFRLGAEWVLRAGASGNVLFPVRAGFFRDGQPVNIRLNDASGSPLAPVRPSFNGFTAGSGVTIGGVLFDVAYVRESGKVPASRGSSNVRDSERHIRYNRVFASMMVRFGQRR